MNTHAIITGDLVDSRMVDSTIWLPVLEDTLGKYSVKYDIFRGDSFQAELDLTTCLERIFYIKARLKSIGNIDVRIGLGIGSIEYNNDHIKNSTGESFIYSGKAFDFLKKELFAVKTAYEEWDILTNTMLLLAVELASKWTVNMAETVAAYLEYPNYSQQQLGTLLKRKYQSQVSTELTKANWVKIKSAIDYCQKELMKLC